MSQADPVSNDREHIADLVVADIQDRKRRGVREYGTALQPLNGRRALWDLYEELLDAAHYVRQRVQEEHLVMIEVVNDAAVRQTLNEIYGRQQTIRDNPGRVNKQSLEQRYVDDLAYLRMVVEALLVGLDNARQTPPEPPPMYEIAGYQYRVMGPDGNPGYDVTHDQNEIDDWIDGRYDYSDGYYPEYRVLLAAPGWYRVDREKPLLPPDGGEYVPRAQAPARGDGKPS